MKTKDEMIADLEQRIGRPVSEEEAAGAWVILRQDFAEVWRGFAEALAAWVEPIARFGRALDRWHHIDHPETIKASRNTPAARHRRRYQRMMARKGLA